MNSGYTSTVQIPKSQLNDFIQPTQACIIPVHVEKPAESLSKIKIQVEGVETIKKPAKAQITLNDCLACSGCITSTESILINQQSHTEFLNFLQDNQTVSEKKKVFISISPQSRASFAARYDLIIPEVSKKLAGLFKSLGADYVYDLTFARDFSLMETAKEFLSKIKLGKKKNSSIPMLTSSCPGWICYAEKTHGQFVLPYISSTKSPQQVMGSLVKDYLSTKLNIPPPMIYHVTVMPCFDKKLEATRDDFMGDSDSKDVDCVITSIEVEALLDSQEKELKDFEDGSIDSLLEEDRLYNHAGSGSGGYCEYVFKIAAKELFGEESVPLDYKVMRNKDFLELSLEKDGETVLRFAIANGFRNMQGIVRKIKSKTCPYDFVEIMACPSGCLNGGAQIKVEDYKSAEDKAAKKLLDKVKEIYFSLEEQAPEENVDLDRFYMEWLEGKDSEKSKKLLHTQYHDRKQPDNALTTQW